MKASAGGALIYIRNQTGNDQKIYKSFELESTLRFVIVRNQILLLGPSINTQT